MEVRKTITSIFMVPTLGFPRESLRNNNFINAYIKDENLDHNYKDAVYLLFKPDNIDKFREFLEVEQERSKDFIEDYDYEDGYVVLIYKLNAKFKKDFAIIKKGKYSTTSKEFQALFPKIVKIIIQGLNRDEISLQYRVFNKTEDLITFWEDKLGVTFNDDQEVWNGWEEETEILNINKIKKYV